MYRRPEIPQGLQHSYSRESLHANPPATLPAPPITGLPAPCWFGSPVRTSWTNDRSLMPKPVQDKFDLGEITHYASYHSPIYDLKPMLQGFTGNGKTGRNFDTKRAVAVWVGGGTGAGGKLFIQVEIHSQDSDFVDTSNFDDVIVETFESGHVSDPGKLGRIGTVQDITGNFSLDGNRYIILAFLPFGEGMPIRYWQQTLMFTKKQEVGTPVPFTIQGAFY